MQKFHEAQDIIAEVISSMRLYQDGLLVTGNENAALMIDGEANQLAKAYDLIHNGTSEVVGEISLDARESTGLMLQAALAMVSKED